MAAGRGDPRPSVRARRGPRHRRHVGGHRRSGRHRRGRDAASSGPGSSVRLPRPRPAPSGGSPPSDRPSRRGRSRACRRRSGCRTGDGRWSWFGGARRRARRTTRMVVDDAASHLGTLLPSAGRTAQGPLRRRHHRWRRARPVDGVLPRDATRHHERRGPRGGLHRLGQHRPEHDDHPRQLRHPAGGPLLQAQPGHVRGARGRDRREPAPPDARRSCGAPTPR